MSRFLAGIEDGLLTEGAVPSNEHRSETLVEQRKDVPKAVRGSFSTRHVPRTIDRTKDLACAAQRCDQRVVAEASFVREVRSFLLVPEHRVDVGVQVDDPELLFLLPSSQLPDPALQLVSSSIESGKLCLVESTEEVTTGRGVRNAPRSEHVADSSVALQPCQVFNAAPPGEQVENLGDHVV